MLCSAENWRLSKSDLTWDPRYLVPVLAHIWLQHSCPKSDCGVEFVSGSILKNHTILKSHAAKGLKVFPSTARCPQTGPLADPWQRPCDTSVGEHPPCQGQAAPDLQLSPDCAVTNLLL